MARWDSPLFTVPDIDAAPALPDIWDALVARGRKVAPNLATVLRAPVESDYLYQLDRTTQEIVALVVEHQKSAGAGGGDLPVVQCETVGCRCSLFMCGRRLMVVCEAGVEAAGPGADCADAAAGEEAVCEFESTAFRGAAEDRGAVCRVFES